MPCYSPLKGYKCNETGGIKFRKDKASEANMEVACGQCIGCRLDRSRMWAIRIVHESSLYEHGHGNSFITLTYRPKERCTAEELKKERYCPEDWSLRPQDFTKFMKRLRQMIDRGKITGSNGQRIKYFQCGEYGSICKHGIDLSKVKCPMCKLGRPHHHAILFNIEFKDLEEYPSRDGKIRYTSPELSEAWGYGLVDVGTVTYQSAAYVGRYIMKKVTGDIAEDHYRNVDEYGVARDLQPEYCSMSNGIGLEWYNKYKDDLWPSDEVPVPGEGVVKKVPRYYEEILKKVDEQLLEEIKEERLKYREENAEEYTPERLMDKYKVKKRQIETLGRSLQ
jgi:hypothetical protein